MDLPATQAVDEDDFPATQQLADNAKEENTLVGTLLINNQTHSIFSGVTKIGRHPECQIVLNNETVSKWHAEIEAESANKPVFIRDLNSSNKTRINNSRLRPNALHQIKDGDDVIFGNVLSRFKLYQPIDDSIVSCTPQMNRKLKEIIPGTPDSSMNTSSASENDVSSIPGTQTDNIDSNFRLPKVPITYSKSDEQRSPKVPEFTLDDLPSPLPKEINSERDICEVETQIFPMLNSKENHEDTDDIYTAATQKPSCIVKSADVDENIYEMATQRPDDSDKTNKMENVTIEVSGHNYTESSKMKNNKTIDDLETQPFKAETLNCSKTKIHNTSTNRVSQNYVPDICDSESIEDLETQQFNLSKSNTNGKLNDVSIYGTITQKNDCNKSNNTSIEDLETQQFNLSKSNTSGKLNDVSIYGTVTQKNDCNKSNNTSIEDLETQVFDGEKSNFNEKSNDVSIYSAPTQKNVNDESDEEIENLETQPFDNRKSNAINNSSRDLSIYSAATQKNSSENLNSSIANLETQPFCEPSPVSKRISRDVSIYNAETQKVNCNGTNGSIENLETQQFNIDQAEMFSVPSPLRRKSNPIEKSNAESIEDMETQQFTTTRISNNVKSLTLNEKPNQSIYEAETQKYTSTGPNNESIDDLETQLFVNKAASETVDESIDESLHLVDESPRTSSLSFTVQDVKAMPPNKHNDSLDQNVSPITARDNKESSFDSGIQKSEQESDQNITSEDQSNSNLQFKRPLSSFIEDKSNTADNKDDVSNFTENIEEAKSELEGEDEEEMFSQNLIEDCPFSFLPQESAVTSKINQSKIEEKSEIKDDLITNDNIIDTLKNNEFNSSKKTDKETPNIINESDSETDEEGIFTNHSSNEEKDNQSNSKYNSETKHDAIYKEADSETDEEGVFSSHLSNESENDIKNPKENVDKNNKNDSETDEEGVFSNHSIKKHNENESETDEEGVFSNHSIKEDVNKTLSGKDDNDSDEDLFDNLLEVNSKSNPKEIGILSSKNNSLIHNPPTPKSQVLILDNNLEEKRTSIQKPEADNNVSSEDIKINNVEVDDLAPTQVINTHMTETDIFLAPTQVISKEKDSEEANKISNDLDLAPTQKLVDTQPCTNSQLSAEINSRRSDSYCNSKNSIEIAPTQKLADTQLCTESQFTIQVDKQLDNSSNAAENIDLPPTQIITDTKHCTESETPININLYNQPSTKEKIDLEPTQIISDTQPYEESQCTTSINKYSNDDAQEMSNAQTKLDRKSIQIVNQEIESQIITKLTDEQINQNNSINKDVNIEHTEYENVNPIQLIDKLEQKESLNQSKRQSELLEIVCNKKVKITDEARDVKLDSDTNVEKDLDEMFEGSQNELANVDQSALLTQQLANILESSQNDDSLVTDFNKSVSSPTLSSGKAFKMKNRRRGTLRSKSDSLGSLVKPVNLNDTIERNLNEMFDISINNMETYEPEEMMTQQLKNILQSQEDCHMVNDGPMTVVTKSPILCKTYERKRTRLSLSINLNSSLASKTMEEQKKSRFSCVQLSSSNKTADSQETDEYFANLKSSRKFNVIDSQSDEEPTSTQSSIDSEKEIVYKRGMIGFSATMQPVSTKEPVQLLEPKGRSFTSDSQSDGDDSSSILSHKKRFSLSLSKHVDLNSSMSSLSDQEVGKKISKLLPTPSPKKAGNEHSSSSSHCKKRILARGTRGFTSDELKPVESEELVSAASTESDEELQSIATTSKKVCTPKLYRRVTVKLNKLSPLTISKMTSKTPTTEKDSDIDSDDSEFLKSMPPIKVAGTAECPATDSQLAAPSDLEDDNDNSLRVPSPVDVVIAPKWRLYREKRYDLVYQMNGAKSSKTMPEIDEDKNCVPSPSLEKSKAPLSVEDILAEIDANQPIGRQRITDSPKQRRTTKRSVSCLGENNVDGETVDKKSTPCPNKVDNKANFIPPSSPQIDLEISKENENGSLSNARAFEHSTDSDSESVLIPKFTPLPRMKFNTNCEDSDSDSEFEELRRLCERTLAKPKTNASQVQNSRRTGTPTAKRASEKASPVLSQRRRTSALNNYNSLNVKRIGSPRNAEIPSKSGTVDQSAFVFQEVDGSSEALETPKTSQSRMSSLTIIRTKRSVASDVNDAQNRPPKRSKISTEEEERSNLQQLSPAPVNAAVLDEKMARKVSKTLDNLIVMRSSENSTDSSDLPAIENVVENAENEKINRSHTRGRAAAANKKKTKSGALTVSSNNSSKENLEVESSDVKNVPNTLKSRNTRLKRNQNTSESSATKNNSKDEVSNSSVESDDRAKINGRQTRQNKRLPVKEPVVTNTVAIIIQDSDTEGSDESEFVKVTSKTKLIKTAQLSDSENSNVSKIVNEESQLEKEKDAEKMITGKGVKSKRIKSVKESDSEQIDSLTDVSSIRISTRTRRGIRVKDLSLEKSSELDNVTKKTNTTDQSKIIKESDSEKSDVDSNKTSRRKRINQTDAKEIESKINKRNKTKIVKESDSEKLDVEGTKATRSKRVKENNLTKTESNIEEPVEITPILDANLEKSATIIKATRSRRAKDTQAENTIVTLNKKTATRAKTRDQSSKLESSESDIEKNKHLSLTNESNSTRSTRQTRKRKVSTNVGAVDTPPSEESEETTNIKKINSKIDTNEHQKRKTRRAKNTLSNSEDSQNSDCSHTQVDDVFEKPVTRPKRTRIVKSTKNKLSQDSLPGDEKTLRLPQHASTHHNRTPSPDVLSTPPRSTPSRNRRTMTMSPMQGSSYKVLFTGERCEAHYKLVAKLGGCEVEDPKKCSILVTDKVRRTYKFLCCLAQGIPIVSVDWLNDSGKARHFLDWKDYILRDSTSEAKFKFKLRESLEKATNHRLLEGYTVLLTPRITQPPVTELKDMVISSGGKALVKPPTKWSENTIIITKEEDLINAKKFKTKAPKSVTIHSTEFILTGILRQKLNFEEFEVSL